MIESKVCLPLSRILLSNGEVLRYVCRQRICETYFEEAFVAPGEFVIGLIEGYFTGDGYVCDTSNKIDVSSVSEKMITGFALLLNRFGVFSKIGKYPEKNNLGTEKIKPLYTLSVSNKWALRLSEKIELFMDHKQTFTIQGTYC